MFRATVMRSSITSGRMISDDPSKVEAGVEQNLDNAVPVRFRRRANGTQFEAGREKTGGRKKGTPNNITNDVKEAIVTALIQVGEDGYGHDGLIGYVRGLVLRSDRAGATLLRIVMPLTLNAPASGILGAYKTEEDIRAEFGAKGIPYEAIHSVGAGKVSAPGG